MRVSPSRRRLSAAIRTVRARARRTILVRVPGTVHATRAGASGATSALQALPDSTLRWLAAGSVGVCAGFSMAGAPRLVVAASVAPALLLGAAIIARPIEPIVRGAAQTKGS